MSKLRLQNSPYFVYSSTCEQSNKRSGVRPLLLATGNLMHSVNKLPKSYVSTSHSLCCQPWWFPKAFAFYDPLNLLALELGFVLKSEQREAFWSLTLICESITVQFQTFFLHLMQILVEKDAPSSRTMKSLFFRRLDSFGDMFHLS